jgi:glutamate-1-semialdehyde 2,1-aminomutase
LRHLAHGVSSTPRASQRPVPVAIARGEGAHVVDIDGARYVDYALGYGPLILGHTPPAVIAAVTAALSAGLRTAAIHTDEAALAEAMAAAMPGAEMTGFVSTGTEAVLLGLRIARATTGRTKIIKFRANYHGWSDTVSLGNAIGDDGPAALGQDPGASASVTLLDWGEAGQVEAALDSSYAAVLVEPAAINGGCFEPPPGFLERVRAATARHGAMLIFDEVITGFRLGLGGAQGRYGVTPDLSILGKALAAGLPIGAVSGARAAMEALASGRLLHRGTFNGNPLSMAAGLACLNELSRGAATIYPRMDAFAVRLADRLNRAAAQAGVGLQARALGAALQIFAAASPVITLRDTAGVDRQATLRFTGELLREGVFTLPRGLCYLSSEHSEDDMLLTEAAIDAAVARFAA